MGSKLNKVRKPQAEAVRHDEALVFWPQTAPIVFPTGLVFPTSLWVAPIVFPTRLVFPTSLWVADCRPRTRDLT
jgi:hypothetical protein